MIALDTNILARYLLNDDPEQSRAAAALLRKRETRRQFCSNWCGSSVLTTAHGQKLRRR